MLKSKCEGELRDTAITKQDIKDITYMQIHCMLCNEMFQHVAGCCMKHWLRRWSRKALYKNESILVISVGAGILEVI